MQSSMPPQLQLSGQCANGPFIMQYGALLIVDPEEENYPAEVTKLADDVATKGLGLIVIGEWYNVDTMVKMRFFDDNTRSWWTPATGVSCPGMPAWCWSGQVSPVQP